jgi:hypothetical protein
LTCKEKKEQKYITDRNNHHHNKMHWTSHYKPKDCKFPFQVYCVEDWQGNHGKTELSIKKGDLILVYGECDPEGHNTADVPRVDKRIHEVLDHNYPAWDPSMENYWIGELVQYDPSDYYAKHKVGHFPIKCVQPLDVYLANQEKARLERMKKHEEEKKREEEEDDDDDDDDEEEEDDAEAEAEEAKRKAEEEAAQQKAEAKAKAEEEEAARQKAEEEAKAKAEEEEAARQAEEEEAEKRAAEEAEERAAEEKLEAEAKAAQAELDALQAEQDAEEAKREEEEAATKQAEEGKNALGPEPEASHDYVATHRARTLEQASHGKSRIRQRVLFAPSKELHKKSCLRRLKLPPSIPPTPIIVLIGDLASLEDDDQQVQFENYKRGIMKAAACHDALVVDSGLASGIAATSPCEEYADFCKKVCTLGITPNDIEDPLSNYHTHQLVISDFKGWNDRQEEFIKHKMAMIRRLAGNCRVVCVMMNNGHTAWTEALQATRFGWPLVLVQGSGDLANEIIYAKLTGQSYDFNVREIVGSGKAVVFNSGNTAAELATLIELHLVYDVFGIKNQIAYIPVKKEK